MWSSARAWFAWIAGGLAALLLIGVVVANAEAGDLPTSRSVTPTGAIRQRLAQGAPTLHARGSRIHPGSVFVVGDSLTVGTEPWLGADLHRHGWRLAGVDARVGRPVPEGLQVLRSQGASLPGTVVIALGTNDLGADRATVISWMQSARAIVGHRRLIWVNLCLAANVDPPLGTYRSINTMLRQIAPRYGVQIADWCAFAHAHHLTPGPDHIHYTASGYRERASFYATTIAG